MKLDDLVITIPMQWVGGLDPTIKYIGFKWNYLRTWSGVEIEIKKAFIIFLSLNQIDLFDGLYILL